MTTMPWKARKCTLSLKGDPQGHTQSTKDGVRLFCRWLFCFIIFVFVWSSFGPCSHPQVGPWPSSLSGLPFFSLSRALGLFSHSPALRVLNICEPVLLSFLKALEGLFLGYSVPRSCWKPTKEIFLPLTLTSYMTLCPIMLPGHFHPLLSMTDRGGVRKE